MDNTPSITYGQALERIIDEIVSTSDVTSPKSREAVIARIVYFMGNTQEGMLGGPDLKKQWLEKPHEAGGIRLAALVLHMDERRPRYLFDQLSAGYYPEGRFPWEVYVHYRQCRECAEILMDELALRAGVQRL